MFLGGLIILNLGISRSLWLFGFLQIISTACFAVLSKYPGNLGWLAFTISFENLSSGMGTAAFAAFMALQTNRSYSATQYALLTALMAVPLHVLGGFSGVVAERLGYFNFFSFCSLIGIPGILLLLKIAPWNGKLLRSQTLTE